jgi:adenosylcobinamide-GDP ribazoletransferase
MKKIWNSLLLAFSIYSVSPKAKVENNRENSQFILLFIPIIGGIIGFCINKWAIGYPYLCSYAILPAVVGAVIPSMLSAGSHLDGFFRTIDALCSKQSRERKLQILEDSHGGYFAIIVCVWYFMLAIGIWSEMPVDGLFILSYSFVVSRALYGLSILLMKHAKESKCSAYVPEGGLRWLEVAVMVGYVVLSASQMIRLNFQIGVACMGGAAAAFLVHIYVAWKDFGGITEDSAGFFIHICEVLMPLAALIAYKQWWV